MKRFYPVVVGAMVGAMALMARSSIAADTGRPVPPGPAAVPTPATINPSRSIPKPIPTREEMNQLFALPLWGGDRLWDEDGETVRQRLQCRVESAGDSRAGRSSYLGRPPQDVLGAPVENLRLSCNGGAPDSVLIMFANKGDSIPGLKPDPRDFKHPADYVQAQKTYDQAVRKLQSAVRSAATNVAARLTRELGEPQGLSFGPGGQVAQWVKAWTWKDHAILLSEKPSEGVSLRILPRSDLAAKGRAQPIRAKDLKQELLGRVERRPNGDVVVGGIPMVSQGAKGYCVPATWSRYLQYLGIEVDEYILAEAAHTKPGSGTYIQEIVTVTEGVLTRNHRQLTAFNGPFNIPLIAKHVDEGMPVMWSMSALNTFEALGRPAARMGTDSPEDWAKNLKPHREEARKLARFKSQNLHPHMCMIIGYNKLTKEIATSDSWGPATQERWFPLEAIQSVSSDAYWVIHW